jgi:putative ABC transport system permease protein
MRFLASLLRLAGHSLIFDWRLTLCQFFGLIAVLVPLLLVLGLKHGAIQGLVDKLNADPRNLEIMILGNHTLRPAWFEAIAAAPETAFVIPVTRALSSTVNLAVDAPGGKLLRGVQLLPTAGNDPLLQGLPIPTQAEDIVLSHSAAEALGAKAGDKLRGFVNRRLNGVEEIGNRMLNVLAVAPASVTAQDIAFVTLGFLVGTEDYRDGVVADLQTAVGENPVPAARSYASARLYARSLMDVAPLAALAGQGDIVVRTKAREIATVQLLDRALTLVATIIVSLGAIGAGLSIAANQWANVERQRRDISILRLLGMHRFQVLFLPVLQSVTIAIGGTGVSIMLFIAASAAVNDLFSVTGLGDDQICRLEISHFLWFGAATLVVAGVAAVLGGMNVVKIDPSEGLRAI